MSRAGQLAKARQKKRRDSDRNKSKKDATAALSKLPRRKRKGRAKYRTASARKKANKRRYDRRYLILLNYIKLRDQYQCSLCDKRNLKLDIHHIRKYSTHVGIRKNPLNLISVCKYCHNNTLKNRENQFRGMLSRKAKYNTRRYKKNPLTYEELIRIHSDKQLLPEDFKPFVYKTSEQQKLVKAKEHYLSKLYRGIKSRCYNEKNKSYKTYGGRGIGLYPEWKQNRKSFIRWIEKNLGERPDKHSLDRIDTDGNYEPGNLRWASDKIQAQNRRTTVLEDFEVLCVFILYHKYGKKQTTIQYLMDTGNVTVIRNIIKGNTFINLTSKYLPIVKEKEVINKIERYLSENST